MNWIDIKKEKPEPNKPIIIARVSGSMSGWNRISPCFGIMKDNGQFTGCPRLNGCNTLDVL